MGQYGVVGDPAGMRAFADDLVRRAEELRAVRARMRKRWRDVRFEGPFATTVRTVLEDQWNRFEVAAAALDSAAGRLRRSADVVQQDIAVARARHEAEEQRRREAEEAARRAAAAAAAGGRVVRP